MIIPIRGGQLENLPETLPRLFHTWNKGRQQYDVIDLNTGLLHEPKDICISDSFSLEIVDVICDGIREGQSLRTILGAPNMPSIGKVYAWLSVFPEFNARYKEAKKQRADVYFDSALSIALEPRSKDDVPAAKLAVDTLKWAAEKSNPEVYGKVEDKGNKGGNNINIILKTGVLDTPAPDNIIVDEFGNFKGFTDGEQSNLVGNQWSEHVSGQELHELKEGRFEDIYEAEFTETENTEATGE